MVGVGKTGKPVSLAGVEALDGLDKGQRRHLEKVVVLDAPVYKFLGDNLGEDTGCLSTNSLRSVISRLDRVLGQEPVGVFPSLLLLTGLRSCIPVIQPFS